MCVLLRFHILHACLMVYHMKCIRILLEVTSDITSNLEVGQSVYIQFSLTIHLSPLCWLYLGLYLNLHGSFIRINRLIIIIFSVIEFIFLSFYFFIMLPNVASTQTNNDFYSAEYCRKIVKETDVLIMTLFCFVLFFPKRASVFHCMV